MSREIVGYWPRFTVIDDPDAPAPAWPSDVRVEVRPLTNLIPAALTSCLTPIACGCPLCLALDVSPLPGIPGARQLRLT